MIRKLSATMLLAGALLLPACSDRDQSAAAGSGEPTRSARVDDPEELGRIGGRIASQPQKANEIIAGAGMTQEEFEAKVREIAERPDDSKKYAKGFEEVRK